MRMLVGLTLPSFRSSPGPALEVAGAAERSGVDGVFAFDHLLGRRPGRPALELTAMLGALAVGTARVALGSLVARASLRHPAALVACLDTVARISGPRLIAGVGGGDEESRVEDEAFGVEVPPEQRLALVEAAVAAASGRGYPVWLGGSSAPMRRLAALRGDGWNAWGTDAATFAVLSGEVRRLAAEADRGVAHLAGSTGFACTWGGLVLTGATEKEAQVKAARLDPAPTVICGGPERLAEALLAYREAGADWVILAPLDPADPDNASIVGELVRPQLG
ncbi:MAG: LLM class flavin-dependent oxidoreductase [Acidimicrobiia bacterium]